MSYRKIIPALVLAASLGACASAPQSSAEPQPAPEMNIVESRVKRHLDGHLKDPYSVRDLDISPVVRGSICLAPMSGAARIAITSSTTAASGSQTAANQVQG